MYILSSNAGVTSLVVGLMDGNNRPQDTAMALPLQISGQVEYLSGGLCEAQAETIRRISLQWPLMLEFAVRGGQCSDKPGKVAVCIQDSRAQLVLDAISDGPYLLARVAPGRYSVAATFNGQTLDGAIHVIHGRAVKVLFEWAADARAGQP